MHLPASASISEQNLHFNDFIYMKNRRISSHIDFLKINQIFLVNAEFRLLVRLRLTVHSHQKLLI